MPPAHRTSIDLTEAQHQALNCIPWGSRKPVIAFALDGIIQALAADPDLLGSIIYGKATIHVTRTGELRSNEEV